MNKCGILISFEGIDGCGKTTQAVLLKEALEKMGFDVIILKEPTNGFYGSKIREILTKSKTSAFNTSQEVYKLFILDRKENVEKRILPALKEGKIVIMDRYFISTIAYQGAAGIPISQIVKDNMKFPIPDVIFILDIPINEAVERLRTGRRNLDTFEINKEFLEKVRELYLKMPEVLKNADVIIIDGKKEINEIHDEIMKKVKEILAKKGCLNE